MCYKPDMLFAPYKERLEIDRQEQFPYIQIQIKEAMKTINIK